MILNEDYTVIEDPQYETMPVKLLTGPYAGVILRFTTVMLPESESAPMKYNFAMLDSGNYTEKELRADQRFLKHTGLVLNAMILEAHQAALEMAAKAVVDESGTEDSQ